MIIVGLSLVLLAVSGVTVGTPTLDSRGAVSFQPCEDLRYGISLWGFPAGKAVMQVRDPGYVDGHPTIRLVTTAKSNRFISLFFPVHNHVDSIVHAQTLLPLHFVFHRREGRNHEDFDVTFHHQKQLVTVVKDGQADTLDIPPITHGPLSCLYFLRTRSPLIPGSSLFLNIHHDKTNYTVEVKVEGLETLSGPWGHGETVRVLVVMPFQGIFLNQGNIRLWLTNDSHHVPVMMEAKVIVGSVVALLQKPVSSRHQCSF